MQKGKSSYKFYLNVANGTRTTEDLEILCKPCNAIHALELKFGVVPLRIIWEKPIASDASGA